MITGAAFEDDLFDAIHITLYHAGDLGVERSFLRFRTEAAPDPLAARGHVSERVLLRLQCGPARVAPILGLAHSSNEPLLHHVGEAVHRFQRLSGR